MDVPSFIAKLARRARIWRKLNDGYEHEHDEHELQQKGTEPKSIFSNKKLPAVVFDTNPPLIGRDCK